MLAHLTPGQSPQLRAAAPPATSDPAADFLAGEQADLAAIDGNVYDQVAGDEGGFEEPSMAALMKLMRGMHGKFDARQI